MSTLLVYDGTWEGMLSAVFQAYNMSDVHITARDCETMFDTERVETDETRARRLTDGMKRLGSDVPEFVYQASCAEYEGFEDDLLESLKLGFGLNRDPFSQRQYPYVYRVSAAQKKVTAETHRFLGMTRFVSAGNGLYVGDIAPDCNILALMGEHFNKRFNDQRIILRDVNRGIALVSQPGSWWIAVLDDMPPLPEDKVFEDMWAAYFRKIANPERANAKLQRGFVPLKHRKYLPEFRQFNFTKPPS